MEENAAQREVEDYPVDTTDTNDIAQPAVNGVSSPLTSPDLIQEQHNNSNASQQEPMQLNGIGEAQPIEIKLETVYTTLVRNHEGLGFSIAGGGGAAQFRPGSDVSTYTCPAKYHT